MLPCALALWSCADKPIMPATSPIHHAANTETLAEWFVSVDEARTAAEPVALLPEVRAQAHHNQTEQDTQRVFSGLQPVLTLTPLLGKDNQPFLYVANYEYGGWSLIAADAHMTPVLGFSEHGHFSVEELVADGGLVATVERNNETPTMPEGLLDWLTTTHDIVESLRQAPATNEQPTATADLWRALVQNPCDITVLPRGNSGGQPAWNPPCPPPGGGGITCTQFDIGPLMRTTWGQGCGYNDLTPSGTRTDLCHHCPTGCVATAMAQVIFFHRFSNAPYSWATMSPGGTLVPGSSPELARLMRSCGNTTGVSYRSTASSANMANIAGALKSPQFGYGSADFHDGNVNYRIDNDLRARRPTVVGGSRSQGFLFGYSDGHAWVCDGMVGSVCTYPNGNMQSQRQYSMNWGWRGMGNGYFRSDDWQVTVNGNNSNYRYNHRVITNIHP